MQHSADANEAQKTNALLNSAGFREELSAWLSRDRLAFEDIGQVRLTRDAKTGSRLIVVELNDGRQRAFPFSNHQVH